MLITLEGCTLYYQGFVLSALPLKGSFDKGWWGGGEGRVEERGGIKQTGMELEMWVYKEAAAAAAAVGGWGVG